MRLMICGAILLGACAIPAAADKEYTDVRVQVTDQKGTAIPRAAITLKFVAGRKLLGMKKERAEWDVKTDSRGEATVPYIPSGKVRVLVYAKGYQTHGDDYEVSGPEQTIKISLSRPTEQYSSHETPEEREKRLKEKKN
jgi:hypothetical protein